jgi:uncharacterized protein
MTRDDVIVVLASEAEAIKRRGATAVFLFGSAARDEMKDDSDVDVFIDYDRDSAFDLIARVGLQQYLSGVLKRHVDLTTRGGLHPLLRGDIERASVQVF